MGKDIIDFFNRALEALEESPLLIEAEYMCICYYKIFILFLLRSYFPWSVSSCSSSRQWTWYVSILAKITVNHVLIL